MSADRYLKQIASDQAVHHVFSACNDLGWCWQDKDLREMISRDYSILCAAQKQINNVISQIEKTRELEKENA